MFLGAKYNSGETGEIREPDREEEKKRTFEVSVARLVGKRSKLRRECTGFGSRDTMTLLDLMDLGDEKRCATNQRRRQAKKA